MRLAAAIAGLLLGAFPASAQYIPRPVTEIGSLPAQDVAEIVQAMGLAPVGAPMRSGPFFVQRARDDFGRVLRVTVDARRSQVIAIEAAPRPPQMHAGYGGPYGPYARAPYGRYPLYGAAAPDYDERDVAPPGSPATHPPQAGAPRPVKSAAVPPQRAPLPRKRPAEAPQETAGTVQPAPSQNAATQNSTSQAAPNSANPPANAAPKPQDGAMPPVAPLE